MTAVSSLPPAGRAISGFSILKPTNGSSTITKLVSPTMGGDSKPLQIDRASIVAMATADPEAGLDAVLAKHGDKFDAATANEIGVLSGKASGLRIQNEDLQRSVALGKSEVEQIPPYVPPQDKPDMPPITRGVWAVTLAMQAFAALLLAGDMFVCANVLIESGLSNFAEQPLKAYAYSASSMLLAMALKVMLGFIPSGTAKRWLLISLSLIAVSGAVWWALLFAEAFPGLGQTTGAILGSLKDAATGVSVETSHRLVLLQIISGALAGVTLWALAEQIRERYYRQSLVPNKNHLEAMKALDALRAAQSHAAAELGQIEGLLAEFAARRRSFLAEAAELFKLTVATCRN